MLQTMHQVALMLLGCLALLECLVKFNFEEQFRSNSLI